jgi:F-type H+-transporting ATPase subunit epsilon
MATKQLILDIITQEKQLYSDKIDKVSAPAVMGEVQILPGHIPLFTRLEDGILKIWKSSSYQEFALVGGFMDVAPGDKVTIMADMALLAESANEAQALKAKQKAEEAMKQKVSEIEFKTAEASLRKALMELRVAQRRRAVRQTP